MYGIYAHIYHQYTPSVSIYTIHGSYGIALAFTDAFLEQVPPPVTPDTDMEAAEEHEERWEKPPRI